MHRFFTIALAGILLMAAAESSRAEPPGLASAWVSESHTRARLIAGGPAADSSRGTVAAGIEIELAEGWKTYWRNPGSSGVPPQVDWSASSNLASAELRYPAPTRYREREGDIIGYKRRLILPVVVRPADPAQDVKLVLALEYGVCKDICIPLQTRLELALPAGAGEQPVAPVLADAFDRVPRPAVARRPTDPELHKATVVLDGPRPMIRLDVVFPGGAADGDVFVEAPDGQWIPMAKPAAPPSGPSATFLIDLADGADIGSLRGQEVRVTLVSPRGQSEARFKID